MNMQPSEGQPMAAAVFVPVVCAYVPFMTRSDRWPHLFQTSTVNRAPADGGGGGVDTDAVQQAEEIEIDTEDRDVTDAVIAAAVGSEAEEYSLLREVQEVKRKDPKQHKFRNPRPRQWQVSVVDSIVEVKHVMHHGMHLGIEEYRTTYDKGRNVVAQYTYMSMSARKALEKWIDEGDREIGILLDCLPDTDGEGQPILKEDFESRWDSNAKLLLKHLFTKHSGELIELDAVWKELDGEMPECIYSNPQFAMTARDAAQITRSKGTGKGTAPAVGGRAPAVGGRAPAVGGRTRVSHRDGDRVMIKQAIVISLPDLFLNMRTHYTATVLYRFWCKSYSVVLRRPHAWTSAVRHMRLVSVTRTLAVTGSHKYLFTQHAM